MKKLLGLLTVLICFIPLYCFAGCHSDYDCAYGNKCIKASGDYSLTGTCVTPTDQYGNRNYTSRSSHNSVSEVDGCSFNTDCSIGYSCYKKSGQMYGVCLK